MKEIVDQVHLHSQIYLETTTTNRNGYVQAN